MGALRTIRWLLCVLCLFDVYAQGSSSRTALARPPSTPWERAERAREALEASPEAARTRADYTRALDAFRAVYHDAPRDVHAAASVFAVAELLAEQAHRFGDARASEAAAGQYRFLRTQYPTSPLIPAALLAEAEIEANDLRDPREARDRYTLLVKTYPRSPQAAAARTALLSPASGRSAGTSRQTAVAEPLAAASRDTASAGVSVTSRPLRPASEAGVPRRSGLSPMATTAELTSPTRDTVPATAQPRSELPVATTAPPARGASGLDPVLLAGQASPRHHAALLSGIRHWSTPDYTRVAIDLGEDVTYQASRVPDPDRLLFDIHGTRLAPELVGKNFAITDGGFLKRIRAAQATPDTARGARRLRRLRLFGLSSAESIAAHHRHPRTRRVFGRTGDEKERDARREGRSRRPVIGFHGVRRASPPFARSTRGRDPAPDGIRARA